MLLLPGLLNTTFMIFLLPNKNSLQYDLSQVVMQTQGEWNPPGLKGLLHLLSAISPLPLLPPTGPLFYGKARMGGQEKHLREKQSSVGLAHRRSDLSPHPQNVQVKGIEPKAVDVTDIHRSLHLSNDPNTSYGSPKSPVINSYKPQVTLETDSYGFPEAPLKSSYELPVTSILSYGSPQSEFHQGSVIDSYGSPVLNSYKSEQGSVVDSYGAPKSPVINSYESHKGSPIDSYAAPRPPVKNSHEYHEGLVVESYGYPKSPLTNSYQSSNVNQSVMVPVKSQESPTLGHPATQPDSYGSPKAPVQNNYKQPSTQGTDTYGSPEGPPINTYQPANQGSGSNGAHQAPLTNSYISVDLKASMPVSSAQPKDPHNKVVYGAPKVPPINAHKLVNAHTALKDLVGTLETNQAYDTETSGPQIAPSISQTDLNVEVASPKYPAGYKGSKKQDPKTYHGHPCHKLTKEADRRCNRAKHASEVKQSKHHTQHKSKHGRGNLRPRKDGKKTPIKNPSKQRPRKLGHKRPKVRPPKLVKVYWNAVNGIKSAKTKRQPVKKPPQRTNKQRPKIKHRPKIQKVRGEVETKPGAYQPPPVIEPTMLGFHPLPPSIATNSVPTYPPEEFVW